MSYERITALLLFLSFLTNVIGQSVNPNSGSLDTIAVYGFSQNGCGSKADQQIIDFHPDVSIRAWSKWGNDGVLADDFNKTAINKYKQSGLRLIGGLTATVYFFSEAADSAEFLDMVSRDADNKLVPHSEIVTDAYRGNMANPKFRQYIINLAKAQIDAGVDGIFFDEANAGLSGNRYDGNEGFDDYHLKDFNRYLAEKYPNFTFEQWNRTFKMDSTNFINTKMPLDDLERNFNYRAYLKKHGWNTSPLSSENPLADEWGSSVQNRPGIQRSSFLDKYSIDIYWKEIVTEVREYARKTYGKEVIITSNGIFPYVDFNAVGLYNYNVDDNGNEADYVPVNNDSSLNGAFSLNKIFRTLYKRNITISGSVPCVLFLDWPTTMMNLYYNFSPSQKMDYWRIYAAEAYAHGLFFTFHIKTSMPDDPSAKKSGILDSLIAYAEFYKKNRELFTKAVLTDTTACTSVDKITTSITYQAHKERYLLHLVNHNYNNEIKPQKNVTVTIPSEIPVKRIRAFSPDKDMSASLSIKNTDGVTTCTIDTLFFYTVLSLEFGESADTKSKHCSKNELKNLKNSYEMYNLQGKRISVAKQNSCGIYIKKTIADGVKKTALMVR